MCKTEIKIFRKEEKWDEKGKNLTNVVQINFHERKERMQIE